MNYKKECRNCEYVMKSSCKGCGTFGENIYKNFKLRKELEIATMNKQELIERIKSVQTINGILSDFDCEKIADAIMENSGEIK